MWFDYTLKTNTTKLRKKRSDVWLPRGRGGGGGTVSS